MDTKQSLSASLREIQADRDWDDWEFLRRLLEALDELGPHLTMANAQFLEDALAEQD